MMNNIVKNINEKIILYLIFLIIPSYLIGIAITEIFALFLVIIFFLKNQSFIFYKNPSVVFLLLFSLLITLSGLLNLDYVDLKISSIAHIRFALFSIAIYYFFENVSLKNKKLSMGFLKAFLFLIFFINFDSFVQFLLGFNLFGQEIVNSRVSGIFGDELILGSFLFCILPLTLFLILFYELNLSKYKNFFILFFSFYLITIYISTSRSPLFLSILFVILIILFEKKFRNILFRSLLILIIFIAFEGYINFGKTERVFGKTNPFKRVFTITFLQITDYHYNPKSNLQNTEKKQLIPKNNEKNKLIEFLDSLKIFSKYHQGHYELAFKLFKDKPILGNGPKGFRNYCRNVNYDSPIGMCSTHPHNYFFQILSELGLLGILFYLFSLFFIITKYIQFLVKKKNISGSKFNIISLGLIVILYPIVPSGNFFNNWISIINYYYIGIYFYLYNHTFKNSDLILTRLRQKI